MSTTTIASVIDTAITTATSVFTTNLPTVISFAVGIILFFVIWRLFKRATHGR